MFIKQIDLSGLIEMKLENERLKEEILQLRKDIEDMVNGVYNDEENKVEKRVAKRRVSKEKIIEAEEVSIKIVWLP